MKVFFNVFKVRLGALFNFDVLVESWPFGCCPFGIQDCSKLNHHISNPKAHRCPVVELGVRKIDFAWPIYDNRCFPIHLFSPIRQKTCQEIIKGNCLPGSEGNSSTSFLCVKSRRPLLLQMTKTTIATKHTATPVPRMAPHDSLFFLFCTASEAKPFENKNTFIAKIYMKTRKNLANTTF